MTKINLDFGFLMAYSFNNASKSRQGLFLRIMLLLFPLLAFSIHTSVFLPIKPNSNLRRKCLVKMYSKSFSLGFMRS